MLGVTTMKQLKKNIDSININLTSEIVDELNLIREKIPNPHNQQEKESS